MNAVVADPGSGFDALEAVDPEAGSGAAEPEDRVCSPQKHCQVTCPENNVLISNKCSGMLIVERLRLLMSCILPKTSSGEVKM